MNGSRFNYLEKRCKFKVLFLETVWLKSFKLKKHWLLFIAYHFLDVNHHKLFKIKSQSSKEQIFLSEPSVIVCFYTLKHSEYLNTYNLILPVTSKQWWFKLFVPCFMKTVVLKKKCALFSSFNGCKLTFVEEINLNSSEA